MLLDFFVWDVKKVRNIYRNRHAVAGRRLLVRLFYNLAALANACAFTPFTLFWATY